MSTLDNDARQNRDEQRPSNDELQQRAREVWRSIKLFYLGIFLIAALIIGVGSYILYQAFGVIGLVALAVVIAIGLVFLGKYFLSF